jgi:hypothetical protein
MYNYGCDNLKKINEKLNSSLSRISVIYNTLVFVWAGGNYTIIFYIFYR